MTKLLAK
jgi:hypothetical protein